MYLVELLLEVFEDPSSAVVNTKRFPNRCGPLLLTQIERSEKAKETCDAVPQELVSKALKRAEEFVAAGQLDDLRD